MINEQTGREARYELAVNKLLQKGVSPQTAMSIARQFIFKNVPSYDKKKYLQNVEGVKQQRDIRKNEILNWEAQRNKNDYTSMLRKPSFDYWSEMERTAELKPEEEYSKEKDPRNLNNFLIIKGISEERYKSNPDYQLEFKRYLESRR
jgi:hypothetical protein